MSYGNCEKKHRTVASFTTNVNDLATSSWDLTPYKTAGIGTTFGSCNSRGVSLASSIRQAALKRSAAEAIKAGYKIEDGSANYHRIEYHQKRYPDCRCFPKRVESNKPY